LGDSAPADHPVLCTDPEFEGELRKGGGTNLYHDGKGVRRRTPVRWVASATSAAVGETIRLELAGLPADYRASVKVRVGQDTVELAHPYVLELGWENAARVGVSLAHVPELVQTLLMNVQFVDRRSKP
jgi:hypothetical protein